MLRFSPSQLVLILPFLLTIKTCTNASIKEPFITTQNDSGVNNHNSRHTLVTSRLDCDIEHHSVDKLPIWSNGFNSDDWIVEWYVQDRGTWGTHNFEVVDTPEDCFNQVLRVYFPKNSASPAVSQNHNVPIGGGEFKAQLGVPPVDKLKLSYHIRFPKNFNFVRGGKLPGLYGGAGNSGGRRPDGTDGFSMRFMWRENGKGEVYAYLPTSENYGTSIGQGNWSFVPGRWHKIVQEVQLNQTNQSDGELRVWFDGELVLVKDDLYFRSVDDLKIDGIFFSTFFGGGDPSWATPQDIYIDFAEFSIILD